MVEKVILAVSQWCTTCPDAAKLWRKLQKQYNFEFEEMDVGSPEGKKMAVRLYIRSVPSTIIGGQIVHVGVPTEEEAKKLLGVS